jgi:hypothetical protein
MRDLSELLWGDLQTDRERLAFIESGRAVDTGILAQAMVEDLIEVYRRIDAADPGNLKQQVRDAVRRLEDLPRYWVMVEANRVVEIAGNLKKAVGDE